MSYRSILVNLDIDASCSAIVKLAVDLARRFDARIIGVCAAEVPPPIASPDGMVFDGEILELERQEIEKRLGEVRVDFEKLVGPATETEWRAAVYSPTRFLLESTRVADLVVTTAQGGNMLRSVDMGSLALGAGRPVLIAAGDAEHVLAKTVLVAWKDTREARRAVADALPFLTASTETIVATMDRDPDRTVRESVNDVVTFLKHHGVTARGEVISDADDGDRLLELARSVHADLIVSGAYGHTRLREWIFSGVTRTLLSDTGIHRFMSY